MRAHVVGNGASYIHFKRIEVTDFVLGCNYTYVDANATVIIDSRFFRKLTHKHDPIIIDIPVIINEKCNGWLESKLGKEAKSRINILDVYSPTGKYFPISSAHVAAIWLIEKQFTEIHIWGCDSLITYDIASETDKINDSYYKCKENHEAITKVVNNWKDKWDLIAKNNPNVNIIFHNEI